MHKKIFYVRHALIFMLFSLTAFIDADYIPDDISNATDISRSLGVNIITKPGFYFISRTVPSTLNIRSSDVVLELAGNTIQGGITIGANLQNVRIQNGIVDGQNNAINGVSVSPGCKQIILKDLQIKNTLSGMLFNGVSNGFIDDCELTLNTTGVDLINSHNIIFNTTVASRNKLTGFGMVQSTTCCFTNCQALSTGAGNTTTTNNSVLGFVSTSGYGNIFERCVANSTQALLTTDFSSLVAGFLLRGSESGTKIIECESSNATASASGVTVPYGILLQEQVTSLPLVVSINPGGAYGSNDTIFTLAWSPNGKYLAIGGQINPSSTPYYTLIIYQFDYVKMALTQIIATNVFGNGASDTVNSIAWSPDGNYLAVGGTLNPFRATNDFIIYRFDSITQTITQIQGFQITTASTGGMNITWSPDGKYVLVGGGTALVNDNDILLYKFDSIAQTATLVQAITLTSSNYVAQIAWSPDGSYVAAGGNLSTVGNNLQLYSFNKGTQTLSFVDTENTANNVSSLAWSPNGQYLGVGGNFTANEDFQMYQLNRTTQKLQLITSVTFPRTDVVESIAWSSDGQYVAITGNIYATGDLVIYRFDPGVPSLTRVAGVVEVPGFSGGLFCSWSPDGQYIATGGFLYGAAERNLNIYQALTFPPNNIIKNNTVYCNSGGSTPNGIGISGSSIANMIIQNTSYANPINQFMVPANYAFAQNVFNQLFGQGPTLLQNISLGYVEQITNPEDVAFLIKQAIATTGSVSEQLASLSSFLVTTSCGATPILQGPITLSGYYCLAQNISGGLAITANNVTLDLNGRKVSGGITLSNQNFVKIMNGVVEGTSTTNGIGATSCTNIILDHVTVKNALVGVNFSTIVGSTISACTFVQNTTGAAFSNSTNIYVSDSTALRNKNVGFGLVQSSTCLFQDCKALSTGDGNTTVSNNNVLGFVSISGYGNIFEHCIANCTQATSTTDFNSVVAGFMLNGTESSSKIIQCEASNAITSSNGVTVPYGILLQATLNNPITLTASPQVPTQAVQHIAWRGDEKYIAGATGNVSVYAFDIKNKIIYRVAQSDVNPIGSILGLAWSPDGNFIAIANSRTSPSVDTADVRVYQFNSVNNTLKLVAQAAQSSSGATQINVVAWSPNGQYIATGDNASFVGVLKFDRVNLQLSSAIAPTNLGESDINALDWSPNGQLLAVGATTSLFFGVLLVCEVNIPSQQLIILSTASDPDATVSVAWSPNGKNIAVASELAFNTVGVYTYNYATSSLQANPAQVAISASSIDWSADGFYVAALVNVGSSMSPIPQIQIYEFNPAGNGLLTGPLSTANIAPGGFFGEIAWSPSGGFIAASGTQLDTYAALSFPSDNVIKNNTVYCNSGGSTPSGIGISGSSIANMIIQNTAYANPVPQNIQNGGPAVVSNYAFVTNVFNTQFQNAPTLLQNISLATNVPIPTANNTALLLKQANAQINSLSLCGPTAITLADDNAGIGTYTIAQSGNYCIAQDLPMQLVLNANQISLDLNGKSVYNVTINNNNVTVRNGIVAPLSSNTSAAIIVSASSSYAIMDGLRVVTQSVTSGNASTGILCSGSHSQIINCTIATGNGATGISSPGNGGDGIALSSSANTIIRNCVIETGNGGNSIDSTSGGSGGNGINILSGSVSQVEITGCTIMQTGAGGNSASGTAGNGGHAVLIDSSATNVAVHECTMRNTGSNGVGTPLGVPGKAVFDLVTTTGHLSNIYKNFASYIANHTKFDIQAPSSSGGPEKGVYSVNPPNATLLNPWANIFTIP